MQCGEEKPQQGSPPLAPSSFPVCCKFRSFCLPSPSESPVIHFEVRRRTASSRRATMPVPPVHAREGSDKPSQPTHRIITLRREELLPPQRLRSGEATGEGPSANSRATRTAPHPAVERIAVRVSRTAKPPDVHPTVFTSATAGTSGTLTAQPLPNMPAAKSAGLVE